MYSSTAGPASGRLGQMAHVRSRCYHAVDDNIKLAHHTGPDLIYLCSNATNLARCSPPVVTKRAVPVRQCCLKLPGMIWTARAIREALFVVFDATRKTRKDARKTRKEEKQTNVKLLTNWLRVGPIYDWDRRRKKKSGTRQS